MISLQVSQFHHSLSPSLPPFGTKICMFFIWGDTNTYTHYRGRNSTSRSFISLPPPSLLPTWRPIPPPPSLCVLSPICTCMYLCNNKCVVTVEMHLPLSYSSLL
jgi:hypothetical protein